MQGGKTIIRRLTRQPEALRSITGLRAMLVGLLVVLQSIDLSDSFALIARTPLWILPAMVINGLFALAGFTMARSLDRNGVVVTLRRTAWRFLPALAMIVVLTALVLGAAITAQRRLVYFTDAQVWTYLLTMVGYPQTALPGVFLRNNVTGLVNDVVWTIPVAYSAIAVTALAMLRPRFASLAIGAAGLAAIGIAVLLQSNLVPLLGSGRLAGIIAGRGLNAGIAFFAGALVYRERARLVMDWRIAAPIALAIAAFALFGDRRAFQSAAIGPVLAIGAAYLAILAGTLRLPLRHTALPAEPLLWRVFLIAYPVQQFWLDTGPDQQGVVFNLLLSVPVIVLLACALWYGAERPLLRRFAKGVILADPAGGARVGFRRFRPVAAMRAALPHVLTAVVIVLLALGAIGIAVFAMQRDPGGV